MNVNMRLRFSGGIELDCGTRILLDPMTTRDGAVTLISHAHSDHIPRDIKNPKGPIMMTEGTKSILTRRYGPLRTEIVHYNEPVGAGEVEIIPFPSGHIYGSAGFLINCGGVSVYYTGDINPLGGLTVEAPARVPSSDVLIIESTYGAPKFRFPPPQVVRADIARWAVEEVRKGNRPVIEAYLVGKSQEVIAILNRYTNLEVVVSEAIARVSDAFRERFGLKYVRESDIDIPHVLITHRNSGKGIRVSGWVILSRRFEGFPLSAHADFDGLLNVVARTSPNTVFTAYGFSERFSGYLNEMGVDAHPLGSKWFEIKNNGVVRVID